MNEKPLDVAPFEVYFDHAIEDKELICELTKHSSVLYGLFVDIIRNMYCGDREHIKGCPDVKFDFDKNKTGIWIDKEMRWEDEHPEFRPAIYVKLGPLEFSYPQGNLPYSVEEHTGTRFYMRIVKGQVSFVHVARSAGEATVLCDNTLDYLWTFSYLMCNDYCLTSFKPISQTPVDRGPQASKEHWISTCTCEFEFRDVTGVRPEKPVLQDISFRPLQNKIPNGILRTDMGKPKQGIGV